MRPVAVFAALIGLALLAAACQREQAGEATPTAEPRPSEMATASPATGPSETVTPVLSPPDTRAAPDASPTPVATSTTATPVTTPTATSAPQPVESRTPTPTQPSSTPTVVPAPSTPSATLTSTPTPTPTPTPAATRSPTPTPPPAAGWHTGEPSCPVFPANNWWNADVSGYPVHPRSDEWVASIGLDNHLHPDFGTVWQGSPIGIPYVVLQGPVPAVPVSFGYASESDPGPYPIPPDVPIEGGSDSHVLVIDDVNCVLYELFAASSPGGGASWQAGSGAVFDLTSNTLRPDTWTSADAAGLPIFPGLARYGEVVQQRYVDHALRFTARRTQRAFIHPATHWASSITDPSVPPMGARFRMKASYDCSSYSSEVQVICAGLKRYGMFLADNGSDWFVSGAPDPRWNDSALRDLKSIPGSAFEVVDTGEALHTP